MTMPDLSFFVVGTQKSATSWLYACLSEHPDVSLPADKRETHYLGGPEHRQRGDAWFAARYRPPLRGLLGDVSVDYLEDPASAAYLRRRFPAAKIIISLRDPIDRAVSAYYWYLRRGLVPASLDATLESLLARPAEEGARFDFLQRGLYFEPVRRFVEAFPPGQIYVVVFERVQKASREVLQEVYRFLGVDPGFVPGALDSRPKKNTYLAPLIAVERRLGEVPALRKMADLANQYLHRMKLGGTRPELAVALRERLREFYAEDTRRLVEILSVVPPENRPGIDSLATHWRSLQAPRKEGLREPA
jgi:hypothetical protein